MGFSHRLSELSMHFVADMRYQGTLYVYNWYYEMNLKENQIKKQKYADRKIYSQTCCTLLCCMAGVSEMDLHKGWKECCYTYYSIVVPKALA